MAVARTATVTGNRFTGSSTSLAVTATCNTATSGTNHVAVVLVNISVSTDAQTTLCVVTYGGVTMTQQNLTAQGSSTNRVSIGLYTLVNPPTGAQNVVATSSGTATKTAIAAGGGVYSGVGAFSHYTRVNATGVTVPSVTNGMVVAGTTNGVALTSPNKTSLYLAGSSVAGVGDYISVQDAAGAASVVFTNAGTATTPYSIGVSLQPTGPKTSTLVDTFTTQDDVLWNYNASASVSGGQLVEIPNNGYNGAIYSDITYDFTESEFVVQLVQRPNQGNNGTEAFFQLGDSPVVAPTNVAYFRVTGANIQFNHRVNGSETTTNMTYSSSTHAWLRLRETGATVYWDTSTDGIAWTNRRNVATGLKATHLFPTIVVGYFGTEPTPGSAIWDNVNNAPSAAVAGMPPVNNHLSVAVRRAGFY